MKTLGKLMEYKLCLIQSELSGGAISLQLMWNNETQFTVTVWNSPHCQLQADRSTGTKLSIHPSPLIQGQVFGQQMKRRSPDLPLPTKLVRGNSQVSVLGRPLVLLLVGHRTPHPAGVFSDPWTNSAGSFRCGGPAPLLWAPPDLKLSNQWLQKLPTWDTSTWRRMWVKAGK